MDRRSRATTSAGSTSSPRLHFYLHLPAVPVVVHVHLVLECLLVNECVIREIRRKRRLSHVVCIYVCTYSNEHMTSRRVSFLLGGVEALLLRVKQEAQLMLTTGSTRLAVSRGQQTWYHSTCYI